MDGGVASKPKPAFPLHLCAALLLVLGGVALVLWATPSAATEEENEKDERAIAASPRRHRRGDDRWGRPVWISLANMDAHLVRIVRPRAMSRTGETLSVHLFNGLACTWVFWIPLAMQTPPGVRLVMHMCNHRSAPMAAAPAPDHAYDSTVPPPVLIGHSMGAIGAIDTACELERPPFALVLLNPACFSVRSWTHPLPCPHPVLYDWAALLLTVSRWMPRKLLAGGLGCLGTHAYPMLGRLASGDDAPSQTSQFGVSPTWPEDLVDSLHTFHGYGCGRMPATEAAMHEKLARLAARGTHVLVIQGARDRLVRPLPQPLPPGVRVITVKEAGHLMPFTHPELIWRILWTLQPSVA